MSSRTYNPEKRAWRGRSYKKGGMPVRELRETMSDVPQVFDDKYLTVGEVQESFGIVRAADTILVIKHPNVMDVEETCGGWAVYWPRSRHVGERLQGWYTTGEQADRAERICNVWLREQEAKKP